MKQLTVQGNTVIEAQSLTEDAFKSFISFIDASEKTVQTYTRASRQFAKYIYSIGSG